MRPGFYVEGIYFAHRKAQAEAKAQNLANQYGRAIKVIHKTFEGKDELFSHIRPQEEVAA